MPEVLKIKGRYEIKQVVGRGGMGIVYKAYDTEVRREVALKTVGDLHSRAALELFYKEWQVLANLHHPNIVEIFDIGEFSDGGVTKPFFVMPMLRGSTLDQIAGVPGHPFPPERLVQIVSQLCRGLQAAHENGLVHRDLKPSNVFVLEHDSVKLIDFGVAHLAGGSFGTGIKGTPWYMSPEQIRNKECTPASDIFALGVLCYEVLAGALPFKGSGTEQVFESILHYIPPSLCDLNPAISQPIGRVIHKAMAKQPQHRFSSAMVFSDTLVKALRNEPIDFFDPVRIQPRIQHAKRSFEQGKVQLAADILSDLEASGHIDLAMTPLRRQIDQALRNKSIAELMERADSGIAEDEHHLALQSLEKLLKIDPANQEALRRKREIEEGLTEKQIGDWIQNARVSLKTRHFASARQTLQKVLELRPEFQEASDLLTTVEHLEEEYRTARLEKDRLYQAARQAWDNCEIASALAKLKRVLELDASAPDTSGPESRGNYLAFHDMVESAQIAVDRAETEFAAACKGNDFGAALVICDENLTKFPGHPLFQGLRLKAAEAAAQHKAKLIADAWLRASEEPSSERRLELVRQSAEAYPGEAYFEPWLKPLKERVDLVSGIAAKARDHERREEFSESLERWAMLQRIDSSYPGIEAEIERLLPLAESSSPKAHPRGAPSQASVPTAEEEVKPLPAPAAPAAELVPSVREPTSTPAGIRGQFATLQNRLHAFWLRNSHGVPGPIPLSLAVLLLVVGAGFATRLARRNAPSTTVAQTAVPALIHSALPGTAIRINGKASGVATPNLALQLAPGTYEIEASLPGYKVWSDLFVVSPSSPNQLNLPSFTPLPPIIRLTADFDGGVVLVDQQPQGTFKDGEFALEDLAPGNHTVYASDGRNSVTISFVLVPGSIPSVTTISRRGLSALVVTSLAERSYVFTNIEKPKYSVDGVPSGEIASSGTPLTGAPELTVGEEKDVLRVRLVKDPAPSFLARLYSDRNTGSLIVAVPGTSFFEVLLDGQTKTLPIRNGVMRIGLLPPKAYRLTVRREGFDDFETDLTIRKGDEEAPLIEMKVNSQVASLRIEGAQPDTDVMLDKTSVGKTGADGNFLFAGVTPGDHEILLRKQPSFRDKVIRRTFKPHAAVVIPKQDLTMERNPPAAFDPKAQGEASRTVITCTVKDLTPVAGWLYQSQANGKGWLPCAGSAGRYEFTVRVPKGGFVAKPRRVDWSVTTEAGTAASYSLDRNYFYRISPKQDQQDIVEYRQGDAFTFALEVAPNRLVHSVKSADGKWHQLDADEQPAVNYLKTRVFFGGGASLSAFSFVERN